MENLYRFTIEDGTSCNDLLRSENNLNNFNLLVMNSNYSVYALSSGWGTGKTCFIKMWENILKEQKNRYIYIDAFKMDYEMEPFLMLLSAFKDFLRDNQTIREEILEKYKKIFTMRNVTKLGLDIIFEKVGGNVLKDFIDKTAENYFNTISEEKSIYDELTSSLEKIVEQSDNLPFIVIIDELDRCRPDFALETLERIKHIFHIKNVKFILVYNEEVLKGMIKTKYGIEVDTERYLHKFAQRTFVLDNTKLLRTWYMKEIDNKIEPFLSDDIPFFLRNFSSSMLAIKEKYNLTLRDMEQLFGNLKQFKSNGISVTITAALVSLEVLRFIYPGEYINMQRSFRLNINDETITNVQSNEKLLDIYNFFRPYISNLSETPDEDIYKIWKDLHLYN